MFNGMIDQLNKKTMEQSVKHYAWKGELNLPEKAALEHIDDAKNKPILDIGIGGGRTVAALRGISRNYVGLDYVDEMVVECRERFPGVCFMQGDARDLSVFSDGSFYLIVFSVNGISMVDHQGRMNILREVFRVLMPGGYFLFSTYNRESINYKKIFQLPIFIPSFNPLRFSVRGMRYTGKLTKMIANRWKYKKLEFSTAEYAIINDRCHNYATMLYYITKAEQLKQLCSVGFKNETLLFDLQGNRRDGHMLDDSIFYVVTK